MALINTPIDSKDIIEHFEHYKGLISQTRGNLFNSVGYEVTDTIFNKAYFSSKDILSYEFIEGKISSANAIIKNLEAIKYNIGETTIFNTAQKKLLQEKIQKHILELQYHQHAIYLEAEKAGLVITDQEREFHNQEKCLIEQQLYGPSILERPERLEKVGEKLRELFEKSKDKLSAEDQDFWNSEVLSFFPQKIISSKQAENKKKNESEKEHQDVYINDQTIFPLVELVLQLQGIPEDHFVRLQFNPNQEETEVIQQNGVFLIPEDRNNDKIYNYFDTLGIGEKFKILKQNTGNSSLVVRGKKMILKIKAPEILSDQNKSETKSVYNLKDTVLPILFDHEIATHVSTGLGNLKNINFNDGERGDIEEAIALFNQKVGQGESLDQVYEASWGDIFQFLWETLDDEKLKKAIQIYNSLANTKENILTRFRRIRMGVPKWQKGTRKKDLSYGTGKELLQELEQLTKTPEGIEMLNTYAKAFYSSKLGHESLKNIDGVLEGIKNIKDLEPNFPIFAGKIIYWKLFNGKLDKKEMLKNDIRSIITTKQEITYEQIKLLVQLKQIIEQDWEYQKSKNQT